jgi:predicted MarR family transcription regulator
VTQHVNRWAEPECHYLTLKLLTLIKDSVIYKVAFGFDKGATDAETATTTGKKATEHHRNIVKKLLVDDPSGRWVDADIKKLGDAIKNRIAA